MIFDGAGADAAIIERASEKEFGFRIPVVIRDKKSIMRLVRALPAEWNNNTEQKTDILFLWDKFDARKSLTLLNAVEGVDNLLYVPGSIVWNILRKDYNKSAMRAFIGTELYKHMTARNINTVRKIAALLELR